MEAGRIPNYEAEVKLQEAEGNLKVAIVMARLDVSAEVAKRKLEGANGYLYKALGESQTI